MIKSIRFKIIFISLILLGSLYYLYPTFYLSSLSPDKMKRLRLTDQAQLQDLEERSIKLGLDLQGGMHLVLELDDSEMSMSEDDKADAIARALEIIRTRVDQFGVSEPIIQRAGEDRLIVELAGVVDTARARSLVEQSAYLEFKLVKPQGMFLEALKLADETVLENDLVLLREETPAEEETPGTAPAEKPRETLDPLELFKEPAAQDSAEAELSGQPDTLEGTLPSAEGDLEDLLSGTSAEADESKTPLSRLFSYDASYLRAAGRRENELLVPLQNVPLVKEYLSLPQVQETLSLVEVKNQVDFLKYRSEFEDDEPDTLEVLWGDDDTDFIGADGSVFKRIFLVKKTPEMTGQFLADANATLGSGMDPRNANKPLVLMQMTGEGADVFEAVTARYLQRDLAIVLDKIVKFAPRIQSRIPGGRAQIEGVPTMEKARDLAIVLRAGQLPTPLTIAESRTVGPSLGADSIRKSSRAALIGLGLVLVFMLIYYRFGGLVANIALIFDLVIIMAVLAGFNATLTLPGIAGLILTIGMAVDANVLIFERIREELRFGKTLRAAIDTGYERAFSTILDANVTTFITAVVLFQFGTGPIKGFAVTLSIGLATSMFTAIYVTRVIFDLWTTRKKVKSIAL
ncbi:MAG: protein translocase subunit SecD [Candidatus Glassbacteria bacterium]|nr:protein translocase subunit SecD [Candidatus Glassbacteria bacterium]